MTHDGSSPCKPWPSYMVVAGNSSASSQRRIYATAHEFMHSLQFAYQSCLAEDSLRWVVESTANWAIDHVHKNAIDRYGYEAVTEQIQDLYLAGKKQEAAAAIPAELIDQLALLGPKEHMRDQLARWKALDIDFTMLVGLDSRRAERQLGVLRDLTELL